MRMAHEGRAQSVQLCCNPTRPSNGCGHARMRAKTDLACQTCFQRSQIGSLTVPSLLRSCIGDIFRGRFGRILGYFENYLKEILEFLN